MGRGFACAGKQGAAAAGCLDCSICDRDRARYRTAVNCPSLAPRPKLPAPAGQRAVTRESAGCRNHLLTGYSARESDLAAETLFLGQRLSFRRLLFLDWRPGGRGSQCRQGKLAGLLCPGEFRPILSAKRWGLISSPDPSSAKLASAQVAVGQKAPQDSRPGFSRSSLAGLVLLICCTQDSRPGLLSAVPPGLGAAVRSRIVGWRIG